MESIGFKPPFDGNRKDGKRNRVFRPFSGKPGVYIIKEDDVIVYVGMSQSDVVKAMYRHFYFWGPDYRQPNHRRITYLDLDAHKYECTMFDVSQSEAVSIERGIIVSLRPRDNFDRFEGYLDELQRSQNEQPVVENDENEDLPF